MSALGNPLYQTFPRFQPEKISKALFKLLKTAQFNFVTYDRRGNIPQNVDAAMQPYLGLIELGGSQVENQAQGIEKWIIEYAVMVYIRRDATPEAIPATYLNAAWLAIVNVLRSPANTFVQQTLGGIVDNCWIEGQCLMNTGILDEQMRLMVPVKVVLGG